MLDQPAVFGSQTLYRPAKVPPNRCPARQQYCIGKVISKSQLRNGDLVFFYRGICHVGQVVTSDKEPGGLILRRCGHLL